MQRRSLLKFLGLALLHRPVPVSAASLVPADTQPGTPVLRIQAFSIAGCQYYAEGYAALSAGLVQGGDALELRPQPDNPYDKRAIEVYHSTTGHKLGYVPRSQNAAVLMHYAGLTRAYITAVDQRRTGHIGEVSPDPVMAVEYGVRIAEKIKAA